MIRTRWFALLILFAFLLNVGVSTGQESKIVPGRRPIYPAFEVDVIVDGRALPEFQAHGRTYVEALRGEEYAIRLTNRSNDWVAVALSVDGLNTIDATRSSPWNGSKWVIEPHQTITISGWQMDSDHANRFYFTTERDSYAARLGVRGNLGVISAVFYRERRRPIPITPPRPFPHSSERDGRDLSSAGPATGAAKSRSRDEAATGSGRSVHHDVRYMDMDLESRPAGEVTICYDYRRSISESNPKYRVRGKRDN
jgi:hypothetical protein